MPHSRLKGFALRPRLWVVSTLLIVAGTLIGVLGLVLTPLPGPGYPVPILGAILLIAGFVTRMNMKRGPRQTS